MPGTPLLNNQVWWIVFPKQLLYSILSGIHFYP